MIKEVQSSMRQLAGHINTIPGRFRQFTTEQLTSRPAPGKWSRKEILGHLVDSGMNNLRRFLEAQFMQQPYVVVPYKQVELVMENNYQQLPLDHLLALWASVNNQIIYVVENIPEEKLHYQVQIPSGGEMKTLGWLICDYMDHMEHHWKQVFSIG